MSMNITVRAESEELSEETYFNCLQTPTIITLSILQSKDPMQAYIDYVMSVSNDVVEDVYDYDISLEPVGERTVNLGAIHISSLHEFIQDHEGWNIVWDMI